MQAVAAHHLTFGDMAARVRRIPARSTIDSATAPIGQMRWWREQAAREASYLPTPLSTTGRHALYRLYGRDNILLYVGVSCHLPTRLRNHGRQKPWWQDVARMTVEYFSIRPDVLLAEKIAITRERPIYNCTYNWRQL